jgi:hypothetical protein
MPDRKLHVAVPRESARGAADVEQLAPHVSAWSGSVERPPQYGVSSPPRHFLISASTRGTIERSLQPAKARASTVIKNLVQDKERSPDFR